ncbi:MOSC N-terminal beta barrel domain-containing protein [Streptomyces sp. SID13031]|uniref:MOSC domain-containing protein n=1 Tax=Streptomyces sp. SID13031 TaxID=2706046 RepID=UPI0013CAED7C|nr:MOSC N-terminal beta barrel domain-containing protein [Streptomyces sp. SID13031]NEA30262.1 MOSC domain-containing protein [Streptomyces sp. SID13031]
MNESEQVGSVGELWLFPVKSMLGERVDSLEVTTGGILGDRAYGLLDVATGKVASAKHPKRWPDLLGCRASYVEPVRTGQPIPAARIELADGTSVRTDAPEVDAILSHFFGREVALITAAPPEYTIDEYHPEADIFNPRGDRNVVVDQRLGAALLAALGRPSPVPDGALVDLFPVSVLTTASLRQLATLYPGGYWDTRRFRMNIILDTSADGLIDNDWVGKRLTVGPVVVLGVELPVPRCVMTNLAQEELPKDSQILRTLAAANRLDILGLGQLPCLGTYAVPSTAGTINRGDKAHLLS